MKRSSLTQALLFAIILCSCGVFKPLDRKLISDDDQTRERAQQKIVTLSNDKQIDLAQKLAVYLHNGDGRIVARAADGLVLLGPSAVDVLRPAVADPDIFVRLTAVAALGRIGPSGRRAVPELALALTDHHPLVREEAAHALGEMGQSAASAGPALLNALKDQNDDVRTASSDALKKIGIVPPSVGKAHRRFS